MAAFKKINIPFFLLIALALGFFHTRGIVLSDEGYIANSAQRILDGQVPYKDFHFVYTPVTIYLTASTFAVFGESVFVERMLVFVLSLFTAIVMYLITKKITGNRFYALLAVLLYVVWGPMHTNFMWPVMLSITTGLLQCYFLLLGIATKKIKFFLFAGITLTITFLTKQNFGAVLLLNTLLIFIFLPEIRRKKFVLPLSIGFIASMFPYFVFLLLTSSFAPFVNDFYTHTIQRVVIKNDIGTPFIYPGPPFRFVTALLVYLLPLYVSASVLIVALRKKKKEFFLASFVLLYYITGIRPTTDYIHLTPSYAIVGLSLILFVGSLKNPKYKIAIIFFLILLIARGVQTATFRGYYTWHSPIIDHSYFLPNSKLGVFIDGPNYDSLRHMQTYFSNHKTGSYIYVNEYYPMIYFLLDKKNPTPHDVISSSQFYKNDRSEIIKLIERKKVSTVITPNDWRGTNLSSYIQNNFAIVQTAGGFLIWEKKR